MKLICLALVSFPICMFAEGGLPSQPYIYIEGDAEITKPADLVDLRFEAIGHSADRAKANEEVQAKVIKILALLRDRKIAESDIIAEDLTSEPEFEQAEPYQQTRPKVIGYMVTRPITAKVRDVTAFPKLVDDLIALGGIEFAHIEGGLAKKKEIEDELWQKAVINARELAEKTLKTMGMKIDSVFAVSPVGFSEIQRGIFGGAAAERVIVTGSNVPTGKERVEPSQYRLAPVSTSRHAHVIYLVSLAK
jgi:uncharacterized protein YggE